MAVTEWTRDEWDDDQADHDRKIRLEEAAEQNYRQAQADALRQAAKALHDNRHVLRPTGVPSWLVRRARNIERGAL